MPQRMRHWIRSTLVGLMTHASSHGESRYIPTTDYVAWVGWAFALLTSVLTAYEADPRYSFALGRKALEVCLADGLAVPRT